MVKMEDYVGFLLSTSYGSSYIRTLQNPNKYFNNIVDKMKKEISVTSISVDFGIELIIAKK